MNIESVEVVEIPNCVLCQETTYGMLDWLLYTALKAPRSLHEMPTKNYFHCKQAPVMLTKPDGCYTRPPYYHNTDFKNYRHDNFD